MVLVKASQSNLRENMQKRDGEWGEMGVDGVGARERQVSGEKGWK